MPVECYPGGALDVWGLPRQQHDREGLRRGLARLGARGAAGRAERTRARRGGRGPGGTGLLHRDSGHDRRRRWHAAPARGVTPPAKLPRREARHTLTPRSRTIPERGHMTTPIQSGERFSEEKTREIAAAFRKDGFVHVPGVLEEGEMQALRDKTDELLDDPRLAEVEDPCLHDRRHVQMSRGDTKRPFILRGTIALDRIFRDMLVREPILGLAEAVVGPNCRFCGQNVLRNETGVAIERWHVDGSVPLPRARGRAPPRPADPAAGAVDHGADGPHRHRPDGTRAHTIRPGEPSLGQGPQRPGEPGVRGGAVRSPCSARRETSTCRIRSAGTAGPRTPPAAPAT